MGERAEVLLRNDEDVNRCLRVDVRKGEHLLILKQACDLDRTGSNLAEETVHTYRV